MMPIKWLSMSAIQGNKDFRSVPKLHYHLKVISEHQQLNLVPLCGKDFVVALARDSARTRSHGLFKAILILFSNNQEH